MMKKNILIASIASLVVIAATTYLVIKRRGESKEQPPAGAPQLNLNNPGDQSDFPAGPSAEPNLG